MAARLRELGFELTEHIGGYGVVGILRNGESTRRTTTSTSSSPATKTRTGTSTGLIDRHRG